MIKLGLKLWNINTDDYLPIAVELYKQKLYDYIELYVVPENLDKIKIWQDSGILFDIHAPHSAHKMNLSKQEKSHYNLELYKDVKKYADSLNARFIVFHGGIDGNYKETARQLESFNDSRTLIENKPYKPLKFIEAKEYIGTKPEEIEFIKKQANCGFCLDIGHAICAANSFGIEPYSYIDNFMKLKPDKIHLSDINIKTEEDQHLNYGLGTVDFTRLRNHFLKTGDITIETNKKSKENLDDFIEDVMFLRRLINE